MKTCGGVVLVVFLSAVTGAFAQVPSTSPGSSATAAVLPASGRTQPGSVMATQQPVPGTTVSVNTLNPSVQISGPYSGSTPSTTAMPFSGKLSFQEALQRGVSYNLGAVGLTQTVRQTVAQVTVARSTLLPNINAGVSDTEQQTFLGAFGLRGQAAAFNIPVVAAPFNYVALQASLSQTVVNLTSWHNYRAAQAGARASEYSLQDARDLITLAVGGAYLQVLTAQARLDAAQAQLTTANAVFQRSAQQLEQGVLAQLNVDQSQVQVLTRQQQVITLRNDLAKQKINLARLTGLPPTPEYELTDTFPFRPAPNESLEAAIAKAEQQRGDLKAARAQVEAAQKALAAARAERLPSAAISGDVELIGNDVTDLHRAFAVVGTINVPVWQGGRIGGDIGQAEAVLAQRRAELDDMRGQIEADVRQAWLDVSAAAGQVEVARKNLQVAEEALEMTRARMEAGVVNTLELVQAQQTVATAQLDLVTSVFAHNVAKLSLARAVGSAGDQLPALLEPETAPPAGRVGLVLPDRRFGCGCR